MPVGAIALSRQRIHEALPKARKGLGQYLELMARLRQTNVAEDMDFQRAFNHFYRIRRGQPWRDSFYRELEQRKRQPMTFDSVLLRLHEATGRVEASFASKLVATVDPNQPVIDSVVLGHAGFRLRSTGSPQARMERAVEVHDALGKTMRTMLTSDDGQHLVEAFEALYPGSEVSAMKMLDLVLWQSRDESKSIQVVLDSSARFAEKS